MAKDTDLLTYAIIAGVIMGVSSAAINFLGQAGKAGEMQGRLRRGESTHPLVHRTHGGLPFLQEIRAYAGYDEVQPSLDIGAPGAEQLKLYDNSDYLYEDPNEVTLDDSEESEGMDTSF